MSNRRSLKPNDSSRLCVMIFPRMRKTEEEPPPAMSVSDAFPRPPSRRTDIKKVHREEGGPQRCTEEEEEGDGGGSNRLSNGNDAERKAENDVCDKVLR